MKKIVFSLMFALTIVGVFNIQPAKAYTVNDATVERCFKPFLGLPHWYEYLEVDIDCIVVGPCVNKDNDKIIPHNCVTADHTTTSLDMTKVITRVALAVVDILMRVGGMVAFGFIVYSGFRFVMSAGNPDQEKAARETAINALIGMVITIFAIAIVTFIGNRLTS